MSLSQSALKALARIRESQTRIYLGARYGFTPQTYVSPEQVRGFLGTDSEKGFHEPFCDVAYRFGNSAGRAQLAQAFADQYADLENVSQEALRELNLLQTYAAGKVLVTGSYSSRLVSCFKQVTVAVDDSGVSNIRPGPSSRNTYTVLLHGQQSDPGGALLSKHEVDGFEQQRPGLLALVREMLREPPWIVFGFDQAADGTFLRICWEVCQELGLGQRPIYVVDPREWDLVAMEWPKDPLRHIRMRPLDFLDALVADDDAGEPPAPTGGKPDSDEPPSPPDDSPVPPDGDEPPPPDEPPREANEEDDKGPRPPGPGGGPGPETPRRVEIESLDGRVFQTAVPGAMPISTLAGQFIRQHVHGDDSSSRRERAVVDVDRGGDWQRCNGNDTVHEAGVQDGDRMRVYSDTVAGAVDPRRREAYLNNVQMQLEELARRDQRVSVRPNLDRSSDRYEIALSCGGWGPPTSMADRPYRTREQEVLLEYPAEAPDVPPLVWWQSEVFHPNVSPKNGFVCLGALQESFTPLFGPRELVLMLIEVSEYRNYELDGVLNREAAIWAQLRPELITEHGGWAYQPTLEENRDEKEPALEFKPHGTGVGLRRSRKS